MKKYPGNTLTQFDQGCILDFRIKFAAELLKHCRDLPTLCPEMGDAITPKMLAEAAVDLASALLDVAEERGLVEDLPLDDQLDDRHRAHLLRHARAGIVQQSRVQKMAQDEAQRIDTTTKPVGILRQ